MALLENTKTRIPLMLVTISIKLPAYNQTKK